MKVGIALLLARLLWRLIRAHSTERAARRALAAVGARPRVRIVLSHRLWLAFFLLTAVIYLLQTDAEHMAGGGIGSPFWPWLHSSALPVFAVLAVVVALLYGAVARWLREYERYAAAAAEHARRVVTARREPPGDRRPSSSRRGGSSASPSRAGRRRFRPSPRLRSTPSAGLAWPSTLLGGR